jgi:hypothetical protein
MSDKRTKDQWDKQQSFESAGFFPRDDNGIRLHSTDETVKHLLVKALVARELAKRRGPDGYDTEVKSQNGVVDVLDFGSPDEPPAVYEIETDCTRQAQLQKVEQYAIGPIPPERIYFLDPTEAPDDVHELEAWVNHEVVG